MKVKSSRQRFNTPINIGGIGMGNPNESESVDEQVDAYLSDRRKRKLEDAKQAELLHVAEEEKTEAARQRKERELIETGKVSPMGHKEENMESTDEKVEAAAEVAAEAARAGVEPEQAKELATGKSKVVIIKPEPGETSGKEDGGGWSVVDGKPVKDPEEGEYTFIQALKVAALEKSKGEGDPLTILKWMKQEGLFSGSQNDNFMKTFTTQLAEQSVQDITKPKADSSAEAIEALRAELKGLRGELAEATDPVAAADRVKGMYESFKSVGLISEPSGGTSLEQLKEEHHHEEKMEEIHADREWKQETAKTLSELPERIGRGIGSQIAGEEEGSRGGGGDELESITCQEEGCGTKIYITPDTGSQAVCPKCGTIYSRKGTVETK